MEIQLDGVQKMSKPLVRKFLGGQFKFIGRNDEYKDPSGSTKQYEMTKVMLVIGGQKQAFEIPKEAFDSLVEFLTEPEIQQKLKDWI